MTTPDQPQYAPVPAPKAASGFYIRIADALIAGGGLIMFLFSFAPFASAPDGLGSSVSLGNAWSFLTPVLLFVVFAAILLIASAFLDTFWHRDKQMVGLNRHHVQVGLALYAFVTLIAFALSGAGANNPGIGWGGIFMVLGSIVAAAGAVLNHFNLVQNPLTMPASKPKPAVAYPGPQNYTPGAAPQQGYAPPAPQQGYAPPAPQGYVPPPAPQGYTQPVDPNAPPTA
jgi:hypothetical protein